MQALFSLWESIPQYLIPHIEDSLGELSEKEAEFVRIAELADVGSLVKKYRWKGNGRKPHHRKSIVLAFIAKAVWNLQTAKALIGYLKASRSLRSLCGWERAMDVPSEPTFARAFEQFACDELPSRIHESMARACVKRGSGDDRIIGHISYDSTAIDAREKGAKKQKEPNPNGPLRVQEKKPGRPKKGGAQDAKEQKRLEAQVKHGLAENMADLPAVCDKGTKANSKGYLESWKGYKLHLGVADGGIPICAILTSASLHDSQAAIPLMQMANERVCHLYDLADAAYCAESIRGYSRSLGHVPIIDHNPRKGEKTEMSPAEAARYKERNTAERAFSDLKDNHGGNSVRVRGAKKVMAHLMFGIIAIAASQICRTLREKEEWEKRHRLPPPRAA